MGRKLYLRGITSPRWQSPTSLHPVLEGPEAEPVSGASVPGEPVLQGTRLAPASGPLRGSLWLGATGADAGVLTAHDPHNRIPREPRGTTPLGRSFCISNL